MKTIFVNPRRRKHKRKASKKNPRKAARKVVRKNIRRRAKRKASAMVINPRRRRKSRKASKRNPMAPFVRSLNNPLILRNPAIRRRRRNPDRMKLDMKSILDKTLSYGGGSALGVGVNIIGLNKIEDKWMRNGARLIVGVLGGGFLKGDLGAAAAGALLAPMWQEIAVALAITDKESLDVKGETLTVQPTSASLDLLSADLQDVLDEAAANEVYDMYN